MLHRPLIGAVLLAGGWLAACDVPTPVQPPPRFVGEPMIRVRLDRGVQAVEIDGPARVQVTARQASSPPRLFNTPAKFHLNAGVWGVDRQSDEPIGAGAIDIEAVGPRMLRIDEQAYPGVCRLVPTDNARFDVVSHVNLEAYLPGVLAKELYSDWRPATYHAQAIAARSYAIHRILHHGPGRHYDVEASQISQAYVGLTDHGLARRAVLDTVGIVLTWDGRVLESLYSSSCGGVTQSPTQAFGGPGLPPLDAQPHDNWCEISPDFRWGPIRRDAAALSSRIRAWGLDRQLTIAKIGQIRRIDVDERNAHGRPIRFALIDERGRRFGLRAESLRLACNYASSGRGLKALPRSQRLPSGFLEATVAGDTIRFTGRGRGHGVGLCQWGAEAMARRGFDGAAILHKYYPGARLERAY